MDIQTGIQSSYAQNLAHMSGKSAVADNRSQNGRSNGQSNTLNTASQVDKSLSMTSKSRLVDHVMTKEVSLALSINNSAAPAGPTGIRPKALAGPTGMVKPAKTEADDPIVNKVLEKIDEKKAGDDSNKSHDRAIHAVRKQVQQGFSQARSMLDKIGVYDAKSEKQIAESETKVELAITHTQKLRQPDAVDAPVRKKTEIADKSQQLHHHKRRDVSVDKQVAAPQTNSNQSAPQARSTEVDQAVAQNTVAAEKTPQAGVSRSREVAGTMQLTTREGDVVTINLSRSHTQKMGVVAQNGSISATADQSRNSEFDIKVDGDLNQQESQSIRNIVKRVDQLAQKMLNGNVNDALGKLGDMGFDYESLSSMQLNMSSRYTSSGINAYNTVNNLPSEAPAAPAQAALPSHQAPIQQILRPAPVEEPQSTQTTDQVAQAAVPAASTSTPVADTGNTTITAGPNNSVSTTSVTSADTATGKEGSMLSQQSNSSSISIDLASLFRDAFSLFADGDSSGLFTNFAEDLKLMFNTLVDEMVAGMPDESDVVESPDTAPADTAKDAFNQLLDAVFGPEVSQDETADQAVIEPQEDAKDQVEVQDTVTEDDTQSADIMAA